MEDEEEFQSHPSGASGSPGSSTPPPPSQRSNGRMAVTVAAVPPQSQNNLTLALPIPRQQQQAAPTRATGNSGGGGGGREDCWSEGATAVLIEAWGDRYLELSRGNLRQKHWKDVADIVGSREDYTKAPKTDIQCKNRIDTVKKKYKLEKAKIAAGGGPSKWPFFERLDRLIGPSAKVAAAGQSPSPLTYSGSSGQRVPMGIPMGAGSAPPQFWQHHQQEKFAQQQQQQKQKQLFRKQHLDSDEEEEEESEREPSPDSADDLPPGKRARNQKEILNVGSGTKPGTTNRTKDEKEKGNAVMELTQAILKFGEAYEQAETLKLQQLVDMEKQRMKFAKEMELQRMQFFMKTQLELSQIKSSSSGRRNGNSNNLRGSNNNVANHNNNTNNCDSSSN